jgi:hypothetical protein
MHGQHFSIVPLCGIAKDVLPYRSEAPALCLLSAHHSKIKSARHQSQNFTFKHKEVQLCTEREDF